MHLHNIFQTYIEPFHKLFTRATESGRSMGGCNFRNILPINVPKCQGEKILFFDEKHSKSSEIHYLEPGFYPTIINTVGAMNTLIQERHNDIENCTTGKVSRRTQNVEIYLATKGSGLPIYSTDLGHIFGSYVGNEFGVILRGKGPHKPDVAYNIVRIHSLMIYTDLIEYKSLATRNDLCCVAFLLFRSSRLETI